MPRAGRTQSKLTMTLSSTAKPPTPALSLAHRCRCALLPLLALGTLASAQESPRREDVLQALRKAAGFYRDQVATHGAYHFAYAEDLSYGRSEAKEGPHTVEVQREGTPLVGMAYLEAYASTGDRYYLEAARATAMAIVSGQHCSGGWDYFIEFDPTERKKFPYRADGPCRDITTYPGNPVTSLDDNETQAVMRFLARVDRALEFKDAKIKMKPEEDDNEND